MMLQRKSTPVLTLALLLALASAQPLSRSIAAELVLAQSPAASPVPIPSVPSGSVVRIDGSSSMEVTNQALKAQYEADYEGTTVELAATGTDEALTKLLNDEIEIAAIGRPLTQAERAQGLQQVTMEREKIAIFVSPNNAFSENLTFEQFARVFRGEITDWSELGGEAGAIRFIDRPSDSDTRLALSEYGIWDTLGGFEPGATVTQVDDDTTDAVTEELGEDGIGYAVTSQVGDRSDVRIISMHQTLPDDPRYPYSQPRYYIYKDEAPPAVLAFVGLADTSGDQISAVAGAVSTIAAAPAPTATASPASTVSPNVSPSPVVDPSPALDSSPTETDSAATAAPAPRSFAEILPWIALIGLGLLPLVMALFRRRGAGAIADGGSSVPLAGGSTPTTPVAPPEPPLASRAELVISSDRATRSASAARTNVDPTLVGGVLAGAGGLAAAGALGQSEPKSRIVLSPRNHQLGYAYWETPDAHKQAVKADGGKDLKLAIYDVTDVPDPENASLSGLQPTWYSVADYERDRHVPVASDRDYLAEIGYTTEDGRWLPLARSEKIRIPEAPAATVPPVVAPPAAEPAIEEPAIEEPAIEESVVEEPVVEELAVDTPVVEESVEESVKEPEPAPSIAEASAMLAAATLAENATPTAEDLAEPAIAEELVLEEASVEESVLEEPVLEESVLEEPVLEEPVIETPVAASDPEPIPEPQPLVEEVVIEEIVIEEMTLVVDEPAVEDAGMPVLGMVAGGAAAAAGLVALGALSEQEEQSNVEATKFDVGQSDLSAEELADVDEGLADLPGGYGQSRIVLMPRDPQWAYTYWDTPSEHKEELRRQGGERLALRLYDVTDVDSNHQRPHSLQQFDCDELAQDWYLPIPVSDRDYLVEIGYLAADGRWLVLARSNVVRVPPVYPSDWYEEQFLTIDWNEDLRGKTFLELIPPEKRAAAAAAANPIYDEMFAQAQSVEAQRVAGSLFGSMQHVAGSMFGSAQMVERSAQFAPAESISSFVFPSGMGLWALPTVSGLSMSGIGFSASMPPLRSRKFWLVADAELIVYGATEPDATVYIGGRPIPLNPDGTFRFQMSFQDGLIDFPILAIASDGEQTRSIHMKFNRETPERRTNTKDEAQDELY